MPPEPATRKATRRRAAQRVSAPPAAVALEVERAVRRLGLPRAAWEALQQDPDLASAFAAAARRGDVDRMLRVARQADPSLDDATLAAAKWVWHHPHHAAARARYPVPSARPSARPGDPKPQR